MAGFWDKVPENGVLVPVTKEQYWADLVANSDQTTPVGWQARDSYFNFLKFAVAKFAEHGVTITEDQLLLYYVSDRTMDLGVIAAAAPMNTQLLKQPRYARVNYGLNAHTGWLNRIGVHLFSRWYFITTPPTDLPGGMNPEVVTYLSLDGNIPLQLADGTLLRLFD